MKALTLHQPWASLIAAGYKTIETRAWRSHYTGRLAIHASKRKPPTTAEWNDAEKWRKPPSIVDVLGCEVEELPTGVVVATCLLARCRPIGKAGDGRVTVENFLLSDEFDPLAELRCGDFQPGRWAWILRNVQRLEHPIPARGRQSLWDWTA